MSLIALFLVAAANIVVAYRFRPTLWQALAIAVLLGALAFCTIVIVALISKLVALG